MRLDAVAERGLGSLGARYELIGDGAVEVTGVAMDSRSVTPSALFACVPGQTADGHNFAAAAVRSGAVALLCERVLDLPVPQLVVDRVRPVLGSVSSVLFGDPSSRLVILGVTGTNGKTTTCALAAEIFRAHGWAASAMGTLTQARTTPEAPELQARLAELVAAGHQALAMEVSSHALDQYRVDGVHFAAGVWTNLTQDHLDYHGTMDRYFEAKARLFEPGRCDVAVVNRDDRYGERLIGRLEATGLAYETFGLDEAEDLQLAPTGSDFRWRGTDIHLHIGGRFNVANALAAAHAASAAGVPLNVVATGIGALEHVRGRFEPVDAGQDFTVLIDFAHTPDALSQALNAAREITAGRLLVVFGAGGDRDHEKRPMMGEAVARRADLAVLTSDNPRSEDPGAIIEDVLSGVTDRERVRVVIDRAQAIETVLAVARTGDVVVIAGKGHETGQTLAGSQYRPFDDAAMAREVLERILESRRGSGATS